MRPLTQALKPSLLLPVIWCCNWQRQNSRVGYKHISSVLLDRAVYWLSMRLAISRSVVMRRICFLTWSLSDMSKAASYVQVICRSRVGLRPLQMTKLWPLPCLIDYCITLWSFRSPVRVIDYEGKGRLGYCPKLRNRHRRILFFKMLTVGQFSIGVLSSKWVSFQLALTRPQASTVRSRFHLLSFRGFYANKPQLLKYIGWLIPQRR